MHQVFPLCLHEDAFSTADVLINLALFPPNHTITAGSLLQLVATNYSNGAYDSQSAKSKDIAASSTHNARTTSERTTKSAESFTDHGPPDIAHPVDHIKGYYFVAKEMDLEQSSVLAGVQVSLLSQIAQAFNWKKGNLAIVSKVVKEISSASHVEISFRDEYLTRADMWHLVMTEMADRTVYKNMKMWPMRTIKASVKNVYVDGEKVQSAIFGASTKPIFRSESARYVLFIQMSKEMWDFDASGSGEIMFNKAINGFLPELFKRWRSLDTNHIVSVVLFTRIEYHGTPNDETIHVNNATSESKSPSALGSSFKDFYRVVASDMASSEGEQILGQLKAEFKVFLRDVCICRPQSEKYLSLGSSLAAASTTELPEWVIRGQPSSASRGNVLEAINLAASQFSCDYVDRDLTRTGVSIAIVSPGTGVFEVDYRQLLTTTNNLTANGIGIDLICLSRMPLHSVPLFKYKATASDARVTVLSKGKESTDEALPSSIAGLILKESSNTSQSSQGRHHPLTNPQTLDHWSYAIPHWIDVSFWTPTLDDANSGTLALKGPVDVSNHLLRPRKAFRPRVRMYELQMMGVMEDAMDDISILYMPPMTASQYQAHSRITGLNFVPAETPTFEDPSIFSRPRVSGYQTLKWTPDRAKKRDTSLFRDLGAFMDKYDEEVFLFSERTGIAGRWAGDRYQGDTRGSLAPEIAGQNGSFLTKGELGLDRESNDSRQTSKEWKYVSSESGQQKTNLLSKPTKFSRQLSFGLRGFGSTPPKAIASTELSAEHAKSPSLLARTKQSLRSSKAHNAAAIEGPEAMEGIKSSAAPSQDTCIPCTGSVSSAGPKAQPFSRPIPIRNQTAIHISDATIGDTHHVGSTLVRQEARHASARATPEATNPATSVNPQTVNSAGLPEPVSEASDPALAPWMTILNPCNPRKADVLVASRLGRWQHIFPQPLRASKIKWRSLCSPAAVPITTDEFPAMEDLANNYQQASYIIFPASEDNLSETPRSREWLSREMIAIRLTHGFQIVVGQSVAKPFQLPGFEKTNTFDESLFSTNDLVIHLSKGNLIHRLNHVENEGIEVRSFRRASFLPAAPYNVRLSAPLVYRPAVRTVLGSDYEVQEMHISQNNSESDWHKLDSYLATGGKQQPSDVAGEMKFWRARFVLIPVDPPANSRRPIQSLNEDSEEEMRLEGIQRLTQIWQKFRYVSPAERRFQALLRGRKDTNPLDIMYQTRNPSAIIAAEKGNIGDFEAAGGAVELLPESELFQRSDLNLGSLAQTIQSDRGVRMVDRRWHWRLHYSCFIGSEMTTWLLQNFRDVETRAEAVELGNELRVNGLFHHVEQRHNFRDGNYFYQIASDYRTPRIESRSWFGRKSVPPTPISEAPGKDFPLAPGSRCNFVDGDSSTGLAPSEKQRLGVALSKSLLYDVDHRKRSYRRELLTLHYDRLHNPDNCYHVRIEWMNVTSKLIEDAIVSWATTVDKYGLKLVEVPLAEASAITRMHPFRAPYFVQLARRPPSQQPQDLSYFDASSFGPQTSNDVHFYQKAILKKFRYVLDFEAAHAFPPDVDIAYSWGKPDYKYAQYIQQSGVLLAQITDEGHFLLLANKLYNNRNAETGLTGQHMSDTKFHTYRNSVHQGSPRASPHSSPTVHPRSDASISEHQKPSLSYKAPEQLMNEFESFCKDAIALQTFYDEILHKGTVTKQHTPYIESSIPILGLPSSLSLKHTSPASGTGG